MISYEYEYFCSACFLVGCVYKGDKRTTARSAFITLALLQLSLATGLLILGIKGKEELDTGNSFGVPYYVGALLVASVFIFLVIQIVAVLIFASLEEKYCLASCFMASSCLFNVLGIISCISGMVFVIGFGIASCNKDSTENQNTNGDIGLCNYNTNNDINYTLAVAALVLILVMFMTTCCSRYVFSKFSAVLVSRKETPTTNNQITPRTDEIQDENEESPQRQNSNVLLLMQIWHLQQRNRELQTHIDSIQFSRTSDIYPDSSQRYMLHSARSVRALHSARSIRDLHSARSVRDKNQVALPPLQDPPSLNFTQDLINN